MPLFPKLIKSKLLLTLFFAVTTTMVASAQGVFYQPFSIGAGYGVTIAQAGEQTLTSSNAFNFNLNYHFTPFVSVSLEAQVGKLTSGDSTHDVYAKQFVNSYKAFILHADLQAGELFDYSGSDFLNVIKNVYVGTGLGFLSNNITNISTVNFNDLNTPLVYAKQSTNFMIPLRAGYEFKIFNRYGEPQIGFDIAYSFNTAFGAGLDGYTQSESSTKFYNYISAGFKYSFGSLSTYRKEVSGASF